MNELQEKLLKEIKDMNVRFRELNDRYVENLGNICRAIIQRDIEKWKNQSSDNNNYFNEIRIDQFIFNVKTQKDDWYGFGIEIDNYGLYGDCFVVNKELQSMSSDYFLEEKFYSLNIDSIKKLIDEYKNRILKLENDLSFIEQHPNINMYGYKYNLYNGICAPEKFYNNFEDVIEYFKKIN